MHKAKARSLRCCYCCTECLSGFLLLMLVASAITLLRYFLEFYDPMLPYSGNKTNLSINVTTTPKPSSQSFASAETLPQSSVMTFEVSQHLTAPLTSSSPQSLISTVNSTLLQQTSPTNHLQQQTSDRRKTDFPQAPTEKTSSSTFPPPFVSVTPSTLLHRFTSSTKQRSPEPLLTLPVKQESPQQLSVATEMTSPQQLMSTMNLALSQKLTSALEPTSVQQRTTALKMSSSQDVTTVFPGQKRTLPLNVTHSQKPFSDQTVENENVQYFKGSFNLVNEIYHSKYSDSTSDDFKNEALKLENMISNAFSKSRLKQHYQGSSIMALKPNPFRAHFIVRMSNDIEASRLSPKTVAHEMIEGYQKASDNTVLMDEKSFQVEEYNGPCLLKPSSPSLLNGAKDNRKEDNFGNKEGFPWHVIVLKDRDPACKGSMITEKWVLSTSSCVASSDDVSLYSIQFGAEGKHARGSELHSISKIIHHSSKAQDSLVLIQLARSPPISPSVHPICLPDPTSAAPLGAECESLGSKKNGGMVETSVPSKLRPCELAHSFLASSSYNFVLAREGGLQSKLIYAAAKWLAHNFNASGSQDPDILEWTVISPSGCGLSSSSASLCAETDDLKKNTQMTAGGSFVCPGENKQLYLEGIAPSTMENHGKSKLKEHLATITRVAPMVPWIESQVRP